jgi:hypothetical protein
MKSEDRKRPIRERKVTNSLSWDFTPIVVAVAVAWQINFFNLARDISRDAPCNSAV